MILLWRTYNIRKRYYVNVVDGGMEHDLHILRTASLIPDTLGLDYGCGCRGLYGVFTENEWCEGGSGTEVYHHCWKSNDSAQKLQLLKCLMELDRNRFDILALSKTKYEREKARLILSWSYLAGGNEENCIVVEALLLLLCFCLQLDTLQCFWGGFQ